MVASAAALGAILLGVGGFFGSRYALRKHSEYRSQQSRSTGGDTSSMQEGPLGHVAALPLSSYSPTGSSGSRSRYPIDEIYPQSQGQDPESASHDIFPAVIGPPGHGDDGRVLFDYRSPDLQGAMTPLHARASPINNPDQLNMNTVRSGSGSSVQSELLRKRFSSVDFDNPHGDWWMRKSQWDGAGPTQMDFPIPPSQDPEMPLRPYSANADSVYSANVARNPDSGQWDNFARPSLPHIRRQSRVVHPNDISAPYLQDNSLML